MVLHHKDGGSCAKEAGACERAEGCRQVFQVCTGESVQYDEHCWAVACSRWKPDAVEQAATRNPSKRPLAWKYARGACCCASLSSAPEWQRCVRGDRKSTRLNSSH